MKRIIILTCMLAAFLLAAAGTLGAQSLLDNEFYKKAQNQLALSELAMADGDYDLAASLAEQAKENFAKSDEYVARMKAYYTASGWLNRAEDRIAYAKSINADVKFKKEYDEAFHLALQARSLMEKESYEESVGYSKQALAALENIGVVVEEPQPAAQDKQTLPASYTVRLLKPLRDCLWRIAGYPFVYNDPRMWRKLYEANKSTFPDPDNPDLILPGQVLKIPALKGEDREGVYDPSLLYEPLR